MLVQDIIETLPPALVASVAPTLNNNDPPFDPPASPSILIILPEVFPYPEANVTLPPSEIYDDSLDKIIDPLFPVELLLDEIDISLVHIKDELEHTCQ